MTPTTTPTVNPALGPVVIVTGVLVKDDLTGISGATLMAAGSETSGEGVILGPDGIPVNPEAQIDDKGRFRLVVPQSFLTTVNHKIKLVLIPVTGAPYDLLDLQGRPLVATIGSSQGEVELGGIPIQ